MGLSNEQTNIKEAIRSSKWNLLCVGAPAGTGKSFLADDISHSEVGVVRAAPTGQAASLIGGVTINSLFGIPIYPISPDFTKKPQNRQRFYDKATRFFGKKKIEVLAAMPLLILDEKDMIRCDRVDWIDKTLRAANKKPLEPFGGQRIIFMGDAGQLPPVATKEDIFRLRSYGYKGLLGFENAKVWEECQPERYELTKIFRQEDQIEGNILNRIRMGTQTDQDLDYINKNVVPFTPEGAVVLTPRRYIEEAMNNEALARLDTRSFEFNATISGKYKQVEEKVLPFPKTLKLKMGCRVIIKSNEKNLTIHDSRPTERIDVVNGDTGTFRGLDKHERLLIELDRNHEIVCLKKKKSQKIKYTTVSKVVLIEDQNGDIAQESAQSIEEKVTGCYGQYPIKLAYASTCHGAQGMTLHKVHLILSGKPFATGLTYVALSRVRTLKNLTLNRPLMHSDITVAKGLTQKVNGQSELKL